MLGVLSGGFLVGTIALVILVNKMTTVLTEILTITKTVYIDLNKTQQMVQATMEASENFVDALGEATKEYEQQANMRPLFQVFKSEDGKHSAPTFDQLIEKMKNDPNYRNLNDRDIEELRQLFEDNSSDDDDEPNEPWKGEDK